MLLKQETFEIFFKNLDVYVAHEHDMILKSLHVVVICASLYFLIAIAIVTFTSLTSNWHKRVMMNYESDKRAMVLISGFGTMAKILSKPFTQVVDWWSDIAVLVEMSNRSKTCFWFGVGSLILHQVVSAVWIYWDKKDFGISLSQLFNVRILREVYNSAKKGRPIYELKEIRMFEASFEAVPQFIIQLLFILQDETEVTALSWTQYVSMFFSIYSLANVFAYSDTYGLNPSHNSCIPFRTERAILKALLILIRMLEIWTRLVLLSFVLYRASTFIILYYGFSYFLSAEFVLCKHQSDVRSREADSNQWVPTQSELMKQYLLDMIAYVHTSHFVVRMFKIADIIIFFLLLLFTGLQKYDFLFIIVPFAVMMVMILCLGTSRRFYIDKYKNGMRRNIDELIESNNIDVIFLLLERREIPILPVHQLPLTDDDIAELRIIGYTVKEFANASYNITQLRNAGFNDMDFFNAGFNESELLKFGFNGIQLLEAGLIDKDRVDGHPVISHRDLDYPYLSGRNNSNQKRKHFVQSACPPSYYLNKFYE